MTKKSSETKNLTAAEAIVLAKTNATSRKEKAISALRLECREAVTEMIKAGEFSTSVSITDEDLLGLAVVTDELRELGYKYRMDSFHDKSAQPRDQSTNSLYISIEHLI